MIRFVDSVVVPGVLSGELEVTDGQIFWRDEGKTIAHRVNLTIGQLEYYIKIKKLRKLYARFPHLSHTS